MSREADEAFRAARARYFEACDAANKAEIERRAAKQEFDQCIQRIRREVAEEQEPLDAA